MAIFQDHVMNSMRRQAQMAMLREIPEIKRLLDVVPMATFLLDTSAVTIRYFEHCAKASIPLREQCRAIGLPWHLRMVPEKACVEALIHHSDVLSPSAFASVCPETMEESLSFIAICSAINGRDMTESQKLFLLNPENRSLDVLAPVIHHHLDVFMDLKWVKMSTPPVSVVNAVNRAISNIWGPVEGNRLYRTAELPGPFMKTRRHGEFEMRFMNKSYHFDRIAKVLQNCMGSPSGGVSQYFMRLEVGEAVYGVVYDRKTGVPAGVCEVRFDGSVQFLGRSNRAPYKDAMQAFHEMIVDMTGAMREHFNWYGEKGERRHQEFLKSTGRIHTLANTSRTVVDGSITADIVGGNIAADRIVMAGDRIVSNAILAEEIPVGSIMAGDVRIQDADLPIVEARPPTMRYCGDGSERSRDGTTLMFVQGGMEYRMDGATSDVLIFDAPKPVPLLQRVMDHLGIAPFFSGGGVVRTDIP